MLPPGFHCRLTARVVGVNARDLETLIRFERGLERHAGAGVKPGETASEEVPITLPPDEQPGHEAQVSVTGARVAATARW